MAAAFVQSVANHTAAATSVSVSVPSVQAGSVLVCGATGYLNAASTITSVTDDKGNTWTKISDANIANPFVPAARAPFSAWYCQNAAPGTTVVTASGAGSGTRVIMVQEFSGLLTSGAFDKFAAASNVTLNTAMDSGNTTTLSKPRELVVGIGGYSNIGASPVAGASYSNFNNRENVLPVLMESKVVSATTAVKADATLSGTRTWGMIVATFREAPQVVSPPQIASGSTLYAPTLTPQSVTISMPTKASGSVLYAPTILPQSVTISLPAIASGALLYPPEVIDGVYLLLPQIGSVATLYVPSLTPGGVDIALPVISSSVSLYAPTIQPDQDLLFPLLGSTQVMYPPTLSPQAIAILMPLIAQASTLFAPIIDPGDVAIVMSFIPVGSQLYSPVVSRAGSLEIPFIPEGSELFPPIIYIHIGFPEVPLLAPILQAVRAKSSQMEVRGLGVLLGRVSIVGIRVKAKPAIARERSSAPERDEAPPRMAGIIDPVRIQLNVEDQATSVSGKGDIPRLRVGDDKPIIKELE